MGLLEVLFVGPFAVRLVGAYHLVVGAFRPAEAYLLLLVEVLGLALVGQLEMLPYSVDEALFALI